MMGGLPEDLREIEIWNRFQCRTPQEQQLVQARTAPLPHAMPGSVFVAAIGNLWQRGSWAKVMDMVEYTNAQGFQCVFQEVTPDRVNFPQGNINAMRDIGIRMGRDAGLEYIAVVDNDALPEPDTLIKMTHYQAAPAVVSPVI